MRIYKKDIDGIGLAIPTPGNQVQFKQSLG